MVAAEDGVMPQTREALAHARAAGCPIVVALSKCDLPNARPAEVEAQLLVRLLPPLHLPPSSCWLVDFSSNDLHVCTRRTWVA